MAEMKISNTLFNDTSSGEIAYSEQLKDRQIIWTNPNYDRVPAAMKDDQHKFQDKLNDFFLKHYNEFQTFLHDKGVEGVIDTWKDVEDFLNGISDEQAYTLMTLITSLEASYGQLAIGLSEDIPGLVIATSTTDTFSISSSYIDEMGRIRIVYTY